MHKAILMGKKQRVLYYEMLFHERQKWPDRVLNCAGILLRR